MVLFKMADTISKKNLAALWEYKLGSKPMMTQFKTYIDGLVQDWGISIYTVALEIQQLYAHTATHIWTLYKLYNICYIICAYVYV